MYAVVDVETTGLFSRDRIVEIAIVHTDPSGTVTDQWHTLVNPHRDLGPTHVHGIRAADARRAPDFRQIAGDVAARLAGRIPVAHNIGFDTRMLHHEYRRMGTEIPRLAEYGVCTMSWAAEFLPGAGRSLADCCAAAGIGNDRPHEALADTLATAELLRHYLKRGGPVPPWDGLQDTAAAVGWPGLPTELTAPIHREVRSGPSFIDRIPDVPAPRPAPDAAQSYLELLDRAMLDHHVSATEADALVAHATDAGLDRATVRRCHQRWLRAQDDPDRSLRSTVSELLGLDPSDPPDDSAGWEPPSFTPFRLRPGDIVVLTGALAPSKQHWADRFTDAGMRVAGYVTRKTALVLAADPDSMSGKAETARRHRIPVVGPDAATRLLPSGSSRPATAL